MRSLLLFLFFFFSSTLHKGLIVSVSSYYYSCRGGSVESLAVVLQASKTQTGTKHRLALLNVRDGDEKTPLMHAVENGNSAMASALLSAGAPPLHAEICDAERGWNLLHLASSLPSSRASPNLIDVLVNG